MGITTVGRKPGKKTVGPRSRQIKQPTGERAPKTIIDHTPQHALRVRTATAVAVSSSSSRQNADAAFLPYEDDFECLPPEATGEERRKKCDLMEAKKRSVQDAIDNPEKLPESIGLARKRIKLLDKQIAQEMRKWWQCMKKYDKKMVNAWLKYGKQMERVRMARYEKKQRVIRTPIIDLLRAEREDERSATAVAASLSSSSTETPVAASSSSSSTNGTSSITLAWSLECKCCECPDAELFAHCVADHYNTKRYEKLWEQHWSPDSPLP